MEATLWGSGAWANGTDWSGAGTVVTGTVNVWGDPAFVDPDSGDYHIGPGSAAIDAGVDAGVVVDMDGEPRPVGCGYDIGADEVQAQVRYVATDGADSGDCSTPAGRCLAVQYAVDQAWMGDEIRVASGVYTGVNSYGGQSQQVYISKSITVRGGYTTTNWATADPEAYVTVLDAQRAGNVIFITGTISVTVEWLHITGGDAYVVSTYPRGESGGGLASALVPTMTGRDQSLDFSYGGGIWVEGAAAVINSNWVYSNTAAYGGGVFLGAANADLIGNMITTNTAKLWGGGLSTYQCPEVVLVGNLVVSNTALQGGGLLMSVISAALRGNLISANYGEIGGGGLQIGAEQVTLDGNMIVGNSTGGQGGGLSLGADNATLRNNVIADNRALIAGGGLVILDAGYADVSAHDLLHNTVARNQAGDGSGILVVDWGEDDVTVALTNTVLVSQTVGISVSAGNTVTLQGTLWGSGAWANGMDWGGDGSILTGTVNVWGDPVFVDPAAGDYHIGPGSAAIDAGVDAGVLVDMDGEFRPAGRGYDIGADEYAAGPTMLYLPLILR
jgi:hypothetical protein